MTGLQNSFIILVAAGLVTLAPAATPAVSGARTGAASDVLPLRVERLPTPPFNVPHYRTQGAYPRISSAQGNVGAVNRALRETLLAEEKRYGRVARSAEAHLSKHVLITYPGAFKTEVANGLVSASTAVVSVLIPAVERLPGGNDGSVWLSVTVRTTVGETIALRRLFSNGARGLRALADVGRRQVLASNRCIAHDPVLAGFSPTWQHYRNFALTPSGLAVGFANAQLAAPLCGRVSTIVPYRLLAPYLSGLGRQLIAGVRKPRDP